MGQLNNLYVSSSFQGLLKMANSATGLTNTLQTVEAGDGSNSPLQMSLTAINISGSFTVNNLPITGSTSGTSGTSGSSGSSGTSGSAGTSGTSGLSGSSGTSGVNGTSGTSGVNGTSGSSGTSGFNGSSGTSGSNGSSGSSGTSGSNGSSGTSGTSGSNGSSGTSGSSGSDGSSGTSGTSGTSGGTGSSGTSGTSGDSIFAQTGSFWATTNNIQITGSLTDTGLATLNNLLISGNIQGNSVNQGFIKIKHDANLSQSLQFESAYTASQPVSQSNVVFGNPITTVNTQTGSVIISGSNNIIFTPSRNATVAGGTFGYIAGNNNILGNLIPVLTTSSFVNQSNFTQNNNYINGQLVVDAAASGSLTSTTYTNNYASNYQANAGNITIRHKSGSFNFNNNIITAPVNSFATQSVLQPTGSSSGPSFAGNVTTNTINLLHQSSSILFNNNFNNSAITVINSSNNTSQTNGSGSIAVNNNIFVGSTTTVRASGSNPGGMNFSANLSVGINNEFNNINSGSSNLSLSNTSLLGTSLIVSGNLVNTSSGGTVVVGRFNATGSNQETVNETVFVVGTGTAANARRNALRIDNQNNSNFTGSVNISGSLSLNGSTFKTDVITTGSYGQTQFISGALKITGSIYNRGNGDSNNNLAYGEDALFSNVVVPGGGYNNTALGYNALYYNTTGQTNTAIGANAMLENVSGSGNVAIGDNALRVNKAGGNLAIGSTTLFSNTLGQNNTAIGANSLQNNISGSNNFALGQQAQSQNLYGNNNLSIGNGSLQNNQSGSNNIAIGANAGKYEFGDNNFYIDALDRGNLNASRSGSILYGKIDGTESNQTLQINAATTITNDLTIASGSGTNDLYMYGHKMFNVGAFQTNVIQSGSANVSQSVSFEITDLSYGVSVVNGSQITFANAGVYSTTFSAQVLADTGADNVYMWLKKNGSNVSESATKLALANNEEAVLTLNFMNEVAANDYLEIAWESDNGDAVLWATGSVGNVPAIPSVILTTTQVR